MKLFEKIINARIDILGWPSYRVDNIKPTPPPLPTQALKKETFTNKDLAWWCSRIIKFCFYGFITAIIFIWVALVDCFKELWARSNPKILPEVEDDNYADQNAPFFDFSVSEVKYEEPIKSEKPHYWSNRLNPNNLEHDLEHWLDNATLLWRESPVTVEFSYENHAGEHTRRKVIVKAVFKKGETIYIRGFCMLRNEERTFNTENIKSKITQEGCQYYPDEWLDKKLGIEVYEIK